MKYRKHKGNKLFKITWSQRSPVRVETHANSDGTTRKVKVGGELTPRRSILTEGHSPTSVLNAFLFGRDRYNIQAQVREVTPQSIASDALLLSKRAPAVTRRNPRSVLGLMALVAGISLGGMR